MHKNRILESKNQIRFRSDSLYKWGALGQNKLQIDHGCMDSQSGWTKRVLFTETIQYIEYKTNVIFKFSTRFKQKQPTWFKTNQENEDRPFIASYLSYGMGVILSSVSSCLPLIYAPAICSAQRRLTSSDLYIYWLTHSLLTNTYTPLQVTHLPQPHR